MTIEPTEARPAGLSGSRPIASERRNGERRQSPGRNSDRGGEHQPGRRLCEQAERNDRNRGRDRSRVEAPAQRRNHDRQRGEIGERHRKRPRLRAYGEQEGCSASRADRDDELKNHALSRLTCG